MSHSQIASPAVDAYATLASHYDRFTADYDYETWLSRIEARALTLGLGGRRALDLGCGTGKSFEPLLSRNYRVTGCDISAEMIAVAEAKFADQVDDLHVADMRELHRLELGEFDLVTCLDDALNYLLDEDDLGATFAGVADVLSPRGVFVFDVNTLRSFRTTFALTFVLEDDGGLFCWRGEGSSTFAPGEVSSATIEVFTPADEGRWDRVSSRHVERHHPPVAIEGALEAAGLELLATFGQRLGCRLDDHFDESEHIKVVYFARLLGRHEEVT